LFRVTLEHTVISSLMLGVAVDVVDFTMFNLEGVGGVSDRLEGLKVVSRHVVTGLFEDRGFVHVVPGPNILSGILVLVESVLGSPAVSGFFIEEVKVDTLTWPASSNEVLVVLGLNAKVLSNSLLINPVVIVDLNVRVSDSNKLTAISSKGGVHSWDIGVVLLIESEVSATIGVVNI